MEVMRQRAVEGVNEVLLEKVTFELQPEGLKKASFCKAR